MKGKSKRVDKELLLFCIQMQFANDGFSGEVK